MHMVARQQRLAAQCCMKQCWMKPQTLGCNSETIYLAKFHDLSLVFMTLSHEQATEVKAPVDWIEATLISHS